MIASEINLIAVDPGLRTCGVAIFERGALRWAGLARNPELQARGARCWVAMARAVAELVAPRVWTLGIVEFQQQYEGAANRADRADISELSAVAGACALVLGARGAEVRSPLPREWKGQVPKDVMGRRILAHCTPVERLCIEQDGRLTHNSIDAVGLGLWALRRI